MSFSQLIKSKRFYLNLGYIALVYIAILIGAWYWLKIYTKHDVYVSIPDLKGKTIEEAIEMLEDRDLEYLIIDSIYDRSASPGTIVDQSPIADSRVKEGRQVFLTMYRKSVPMEKLGIVVPGEYSTVAMIKLKNKGIDYDTLYEENNTFPGSIIRITQRGRMLGHDDMLPRGSKVLLVIGRAVERKVVVPPFYGMTCLQAKAIMDTMHLICNCRFEPNIANPTYEDSSTYQVCRQDPVHDPLIKTRVGRIVDLWLYNTPCAEDTISEQIQQIYLPNPQ
ncbi:MAG: PASTA domain-containing protein [Flavobacteriales bacterium]